MTNNIILSSYPLLPMAPILIFIAIQTILCFASAKSSSIGFTLPLIPRFSPESPFYRENLTEEIMSQELIRQSEARAIYLDLQSSDQHYSPDNIQLRVKYDPFFYVTKLAIGTPAKTQVLLVDTGSSIIWTQCEPCTNCFSQTTPIFNPAQSSSYHKQPCDSSCVQPFYSCVDGVCNYQIKYKGGASSSGIISKETFNFDKVGGGMWHSDIIFGCGHDNNNVSFKGKETSGIVGLNGFRHSLVQQLLPSTQGRFSYCLISGMSKSSLLKFGEDAVLPSGPEVRTLGFVKQNISQNYYLDLIDISVGTQRLRLPPGTFAIKEDRSGGCIIDSGASYSMLDDGPYYLVTDAFNRYYTSQGLERVQNSTSGYQYCYRIKPNFRKYIGMTLHFGGSVDYVIKPANTNIQFSSGGGYFCLVLMSRKGRNVIGAWQQQNMRIVYDMSQQLLHFKPDDCVKDAI